MRTAMLASETDFDAWRTAAREMRLAGVEPAAARFVVEFVRQPDAQFVSMGNPLGWAVQMDGFGLTMGQLLSAPMFLFGLALVVLARRKT